MPDPKPTTAAPRLKLVIRRLPPTIPGAIFWSTVSPWIDEGKSTWRKWYPGKKADERSSSVRQQRVFSRAYVMMADFEKLQAFASAFDGHVFRGKDGSEHQAVVEYAPSQKIPSQKSKPRVDARQGQIDKDPDYLSFLESLAAPVPKPEVTTATSEPFDNRKSTPLLEFLKEQRTGKRSGANDKSGNGAPQTHKDAGGRNGRKEKDKDNKTDKKAGGGKNGNGKPPQGKVTTGGPSSVPPTSVPGQIKIAKRPAADEQMSKDGRQQQKKGPMVPLPDVGKRGEVSIQVKSGAGNGMQSQGGGNQAAAGKGKRGRDDVAGKGPTGNQKPNAKPDGNKTPVGKAKDTARPQQTDGETPTQRQRPARVPAIAGARNLLSAALKSSTRDTTPSGRSKPGEGEAGKGGRPAPGNGAAGTVTGNGDAASGPPAEKAKRPPRNRNRKPAAGGAGGNQQKTGDQAGAATARIDA